MYLTDKRDNLTKWQIPFGGVAIAAYGFLLLWCDEDQNQNGLHTNFKLSTNGEFIALVASDGVTIIDSLSSGLQTTDVSFGRNPDGANNWQFFSAATPGTANRTSDVFNSKSAPQEYQLLQNYPNPFNAQTRIGFFLPKTAFINISVFNINGQLIAELINERKEAGYHSVPWKTKNNYSGLYFYKFQSENFCAIKKCLLIK